MGTVDPVIQEVVCFFLQTSNRFWLVVPKLVLCLQNIFLGHLWYCSSATAIVSLSATPGFKNCINSRK